VNNFAKKTALTLFGIGIATLSSFGVACNDSATVGNVVGGGTDAYDDCAGWFSGNINGNATELTDIAGFFGGAVADWTYQGKSDDSSGGPFTGNSGATSGTLTFDSAITSDFVVGIKGGPSYSYYFFNANASGIESIDFDTLGIVKGSGGAGPGLSHMALYTKRSTGTPVSDAGSALAMIGAGLVGIGLLRRRQS